MNDELLNTEQVAKWLKVDERTVTNYRNLKENPLPFVKLGGAIRFRPESVKAWIGSREKNTQNAQAPSPQRPKDSTGPMGHPNS